MRNAESSPDPWEASLKRRRRQAEAKLKLAFLSRHDSLIRSYHRLAERTDLTAEEIERWRQRRRAEYLRCAGVEIEQRDALFARLREVAATGERSVQQVLAELRDQRNGSSDEPRVSVTAGAGE